MREFSCRTIPLLMIATLFASGAILLAEDQSPQLNPREVMAVTIDKSLLNEPGAVEVLSELLDIGQVMIIDKNAESIPWLASAGIVMDVPVDQAYGVITDFENVPEYMPQTEGSRVKHLGPDFYDIEFDVVVRIVYIPIKADFNLYQYNQPPNRTDWASKTPEAALNYGYWELAPLDEGKRAMGFYSLYTRANQGFVKRIFELEPSLEMLACMSTGVLVVRATKERAEELFRKTGGKPPPKKPRTADKVVDVLKGSPKAVQYLASKGRLLVLEEEDTVWSNVALILDAPPEQAWQWLVDVEKQSSIDPRVKATILEKTDKSMKVKYELEVYLVLSFKFEYVLTYELDKPKRITWDTVEDKSDVKGVKGSWDLIPVDGGKKTLALYRTTVDFRSMGFLMQALLRIEPTFELALQASQSLVAVDNLQNTMTMSEQERRKAFEERTKAARESKELPVPE